MQTQNLEVWLRGPLADIPALLQPVAHALLQVQEELSGLDLSESRLWLKPGGVASVGFHMQHLSGVLDRLFTYASNQQFSEDQLSYLQNEGQPQAMNCTFQDLRLNFTRQVQLALEQLKQTDVSTLTDIRYVGRARIESTHIGLLFHAAEHTQRHFGQLLVTIRILNAKFE